MDTQPGLHNLPRSTQIPSGYISFEQATGPVLQNLPHAGQIEKKLETRPIWPVYNPTNDLVSKPYNIGMTWAQLMEVNVQFLSNDKGHYLC